MKKQQSAENVALTTVSVVMKTSILKGVIKFWYYKISVIIIFVDTQVFLKVHTINYK